MKKQIIPFNDSRFAACMAYLSSQHGATITKFEAVKLHVLIDTIHTIRHGVPMIGGFFEPWTNGPVSSEAYITVTEWLHSYSSDDHTTLLRAVEDDEANERLLKAAGEVDTDDFSDSELAAMNFAWEIVKQQDHEKVKEYFHSKDTFIGRAYESAKEGKRAISWTEIIDAFDALNQSDHSHVKTLIGA